MPVKPIDRVWVTALTHQSIAINAARVILLDPIAIVVILLNDSDGCRCHIQGGDLILLNFLPNYAGVRYDGLSFKEN